MMYFHRSTSGKLSRPLPFHCPAQRITKRGPPARRIAWERKNLPSARLDPTIARYRAPLLSAEVCVVVWIWSSLLTLRQEARRRANIAAAVHDLNALRERLAGAKTRLRGAPEIDLTMTNLLDKHHVARYVSRAASAPMALA
jgi:hypothetical protein